MVNHPVAVANLQDMTLLVRPEGLLLRKWLE